MMRTTILSAVLLLSLTATAVHGKKSPSTIHTVTVHEYGAYPCESETYIGSFQMAEKECASNFLGITDSKTITVQCTPHAKCVDLRRYDGKGCAGKFTEHLLVPCFSCVSDGNYYGCERGEKVDGTVIGKVSAYATNSTDCVLRSKTPKWSLYEDDVCHNVDVSDEPESSGEHWNSLILKNKYQKEDPSCFTLNVQPFYIDSLGRYGEETCFWPRPYQVGPFLESQCLLGKNDRFYRLHCSES